MESQDWSAPIADDRRVFGDTAQPTMHEVAQQQAQQQALQHALRQAQPVRSEYELTGSPVFDAKPKGRIGRKLVAGLGALSLIGGATFAARSFAGQSSNTPTEAVQSMMAAAQKSDLLGMMEQLAPGERNLLIESGVPILEELKRLDVLSPSTNLNAVDATKVTFAGQTFSETPLRDDIATVRISGGTVTTSGSATKLFGKTLKKFAGDSLTDAPQKTENFAGVTITTIKRNGHWYVSGAYSIAEAVRVESGKPMPTEAQSIAPAGADTPELAMRQMIEAAGALDARKAIALLDPEEFGALQDYAPLFINDVEKNAAKVRSKYTVSFPNLQIAATKNGSTAQVKITNMSVDLTIPDLDGKAIHTVIDGDCVSISIAEKSSKRCGAEVGKLFNDLSDRQDSSYPYQDFKLDQGKQAETTVVQRNGKWFIAPIRTVLSSVLVKMKSAKPSDLTGDLGPFGLFAGNPLADSLIGMRPRTQPTYAQSSDTFPTEEPFDTVPPALESIPADVPATLPPAPELPATAPLATPARIETTTTTPTPTPTPPPTLTEVTQAEQTLPPTPTETVEFDQISNTLP